MFTRVWTLHPLLKLQLLCFVILNIWLTAHIGKIINNFCQGAITALTTNPDTVASTTAAAVIALGIIGFLVSIVEVMAEIYVPRDRIAEEGN